MASAAITQAIMESGIPIAKADADRYAQMDMANLNNQQQSVMQNAMTYAAMDKANLDVRTQVAVNNAKSFLTLDLQNLSNEEKMREIDYAGQLQTLTSNQAAQNSAAQFNAQSQNQIDEFFAELGSQVETGNMNRMAAQEQFNVNEKNAVAQYNASLADARERFNTQMSTQIAQSNAVWRREINTAETANQNAANQQNAQNLLGITQASLDALWQRYRDEAGWALKIAESQEQRFHEIGLLGMEIDSNTDRSLKVKSGLLYLPAISVPLKVLPISCLYIKPSAYPPCKTITSPSSTKWSVLAGFIPLISANSNFCPLSEHMIPLV